MPELSPVRSKVEAEVFCSQVPGEAVATSHAHPSTGLLRAGVGEPEMNELHDQMEGDLRLRRLSENTSVNYLGCVTRFETWHGRAAGELGRAEVLAFLTWLVREQGVSPSTQGGYQAALCFLYRFTLDRPEVVAGIPWPRPRTRLPAVLTRSEIEAIFAATALPKHRAAFLAGYAAGLRVSEVVHLKIGDIDSGRGVLHVRGGKGGRDREALLPPILVSELRAYRLQGGSQGPYLFPNRTREGQPMGRGALTAAFRRAVERAGIQRPMVSFRSLRVTFATHMLEDGVALPVIQQLMGHSSMRTTARYLRVTSPMLMGARSPAEALTLRPPKTSRSAAGSGG